MKILVCGGRDFTDWWRLSEVLGRIHATTPITSLIHGGALGADSLGARWAGERGIPHTCFRAEWDRYGRGAGFIRNQRMLDEGRPNLVVAFQGGHGTQDMIRRAQKTGIPIWGANDAK